MTLIELRSGRTIQANRAIISVVNNNGVFELYQGFDGFIPLITNEADPRFTREELLEIAENGIHQWQEFIFAINNGDVKIVDEKIEKELKNEAPNE